MPDPVTPTLILRHQFETYMECGATPAFALVGEGFTAFPVALNPAEYTRKYVNDKTERSDVVGYAPSIAYSCDCVAGNAVVDEIIQITDEELLGDDAIRDIVQVNCWDEVSTGVFFATKRSYAIVPEGKGDGTEALVYTGTMKAHGDLIIGTFTMATKTFTADEDA